jgi:hypothetical protein
VFVEILVLCVLCCAIIYFLAIFALLLNARAVLYAFYADYVHKFCSIKFFTEATSGALRWYVAIDG